MAWWRRAKRPGPVAVSVVDPTVAATTTDAPGLVLGDRRLPRITVTGAAHRLQRQARASFPAGTGEVGVLTAPDTMVADGAVSYLGLCERPSIVVRLTPAMRRDLYDVGEAIEDEGATLYLDAHPGFLRSSLLLPLLDVDLDTAMLLSGVDVQEFLAAAYATETIELHVSHTRHDRLLAFVCAAPGLREVIDAGFELFTRPAPKDLHAALGAVNGTLNPAARVSLRVTGRAELHYKVVVEV